MEYLNLDFDSLVLPDNISTFLSVGGIFVLSVVIVALLVLFKRWKSRLVPGILGLFGYAVMVFLLVNLIMTGLGAIPSVNAAFTYNTTAYTLIYYLVNALCYLGGGYLILRVMEGRYTHAGDVYIAGFGLGLGEAILFGITSFYDMTWVTLIQQQGLQESLSQMLSDSTESAAQQLWNSLSPLYTAPVAWWTLLGMNCAFDLLLQVAFLVLLAGVIKKQLPNYWIGVILLLQFGASLPMQLCDASSLAAVFIAFGLKTLLFVLTVYLTFYGPGKEIQFDKN